MPSNSALHALRWVTSSHDKPKVGVKRLCCNCREGHPASVRSRLSGSRLNRSIRPLLALANSPALLLLHLIGERFSPPSKPPQSVPVVPQGAPKAQTQAVVTAAAPFASVGVVIVPHTALPSHAAVPARALSTSAMPTVASAPNPRKKKNQNQQRKN